MSSLLLKESWRNTLQPIQPGDTLQGGLFCPWESIASLSLAASGPAFVKAFGTRRSNAWYSVTLLYDTDTEAYRNITTDS